MGDWVDALAANMGAGDQRIHDNSKWDPSSWPADAVGVGLHEAPRGALSHWVNIHNGAIANYQCVVPSTWNAGPRDAKGRRGPYEEALLNTPVADAEQAARDPAHRALVRSVHGVRRPRRRRARPRDREGEGGMSAVAAAEPVRTRRSTSSSASTCGRSRCASRTG